MPFIGTPLAMSTPYANGGVRRFEAPNGTTFPGSLALELVATMPIPAGQLLTDAEIPDEEDIAILRVTDPADAPAHPPIKFGLHLPLLKSTLTGVNGDIQSTAEALAMFAPGDTPVGPSLNSSLAENTRSVPLLSAAPLLKARKSLRGEPSEEVGLLIRWVLFTSPLPIAPGIQPYQLPASEDSASFDYDAYITRHFEARRLARAPKLHPTGWKHLIRGNAKNHDEPYFGESESDSSSSGSDTDDSDIWEEDSDSEAYSNLQATADGTTTNPSSAAFEVAGGSLSLGLSPAISSQAPGGSLAVNIAPDSDFVDYSDDEDAEHSQNLGPAAGPGK
ncbi:hypothetical protein BJ508DRAFT_346188 [Ascobolus immersus RN42]|uniref:Uncharacterized protein n=1 Tax=Ascobolus immersus RN42 TaxID=1160509 RepID=A0A3N4HAP4_ASCIM|nr:hypothetical protein BJ508DRAFT_346188 [Ascobolus immersus RN42]